MIMNLKWYNFSKKKPNNYKEPSIYEDDADWCWFTYYYPNKPYLKNEIFLSPYPCPYINKTFQGYETHMKPSPGYEDGLIIILHWCYHNDIRTIINNVKPNKINSKSLHL